LVFAEVSNIDFLDPISIGNLVFHLDTATPYCVYNLLTLEDKLEGYRRKPSKPVSFVKFDKVYLEVQEDYFISIMLPAAFNDTNLCFKTRHRVPENNKGATESSQSWITVLCFVSLAEVR
jgi:hypothetical protein